MIQFFVGLALMPFALVGCLVLTLFALPAFAQDLVVGRHDHVTLDSREIVGSLSVVDKAHVVIVGGQVGTLTITDLGKVWFQSGSLAGPVSIAEKGKLFLTATSATLDGVPYFGSNVKSEDCKSCTFSWVNQDGTIVTVALSLSDRAKLLTGLEERTEPEPLP